jgi:hypothetical protein
MKKLLSHLLAVLCAASLHAATGKATIAFTGPTQAGVEYVAQQRSGTAAAPVWTEVAKGPSSPLTVTLPDVVPGVYVYRVIARLVEAPVAVSAPSNEASGIVLPAQPTGTSVTIAFSTAP